MIATLRRENNSSFEHFLSRRFRLSVPAQSSPIRPIQAATSTTGAARVSMMRRQIKETPNSKRTNATKDDVDDVAEEGEEDDRRRFPVSVFVQQKMLTLLFAP
eukprot:GHVS01083284.1.p2 GENE.GHVS01083284.1~~GHVS01083284.1.p2  ORF type:complete len:103 (-),score=16.72 GHVS01083284.1:133-441(-)